VNIVYEHNHLKDQAFQLEYFHAQHATQRFAITGWLAMDGISQPVQQISAVNLNLLITIAVTKL